MEDRRKKRTRRGVLALAVALCLTAAALPGSAQAYQQIYCQQYVASLDYCPSSGLHSWYFNSAATNSGQTVCEYMWNAHNGVIRGGWVGCRYSYTDRTWNRTGDPWYNARNYNGTYGVAIYMTGNAIA